MLADTQTTYSEEELDAAEQRPLAEVIVDVEKLERKVVEILGRLEAIEEAHDDGPVADAS